MESVVIIGAGIIGSHIALLFAEKGHEVYLIEKNQKIGLETSSRNSGVIHAGIYYPPNSLKAALCVEGNRLTRQFLNKYKIRHKNTGKYIVAINKSEDLGIEKLYNNAIYNGVKKLSRVVHERVTSAVPFINCSSAIFSGTTSIVDMAEYLQVMFGLLDSKKVNVITSCRAINVNRQTVETDRGEITADIVINAAGLYADELAKTAGIDTYSIKPLKGDYYLTQSLKLDIPVYPVPDSVHNTLGVHLTPTFTRKILIGPSESPSSGKDDYSIETPREVFEKSLERLVDKKYFKQIKMDEEYSGNRPRLYHNNKRCDDFTIIEHPSGIYHLLGMESPGLTAAPAIAKYLYNMII